MSALATVVDAEPDRLVICRPQPGSATAANLEFLDALGRQPFDGG